MSNKSEQPSWTIHYRCQRCNKPCEITVHKPGFMPSYCADCAKAAGSERVKQWRKNHPEAAKAAAQKQNDKRRKPMPTEAEGRPVSPHQELILKWAQVGSEDLVVEENLGDARNAVIIASMKLAPGPISDKTLLVFDASTRDELTKKLNDKRIKVQTIYEAGQRALDQNWAVPPTGQRRRKYAKLCEKWLMDAVSVRLDDNDLTPLGGYAAWGKALKDICDLVRLTLTNPSDRQALVALVQLHHISLDLPDWTLELVASILLEGESLAREDQIYDSIDCIWLPIIWSLDLEQYIFIAVDDSHNLKTLEREFILRLRKQRGRIIWFSSPYPVCKQ